jgi:hypothetical protein
MPHDESPSPNRSADDPRVANKENSEVDPELEAQIRSFAELVIDIYLASVQLRERTDRSNAAQTLDVAAFPPTMDIKVDSNTNGFVKDK